MQTVDQRISRGAREGAGPPANPKMDDLIPNRTMIALQLTQEEATEPEINTNIKTLAELFEHYQPAVEAEFETIDGGSITESVHFRNLGDFRPKGIATQSALLADMQLEMDTLLELLQQLSRNKKLRGLLEDKAGKAAYLAALEALAAEL